MCVSHAAWFKYIGKGCEVLLIMWVWQEEVLTAYQSVGSILHIAVYQTQAYQTMITEEKSKCQFFSSINRGNPKPL